MFVKIRTKEARFSMPVPVSMIGLVVRLCPERLFEELRAQTPEPYRQLATKETAAMVLGECQKILRENKGLEVIHVEGADGTFVSVRL